MEKPKSNISESQKKATRKYLSKFIDIKVRVLPEEHAMITTHAEKMGDKSTAAFIKRSIAETMERDKNK